MIPLPSKLPNHPDLGQCLDWVREVPNYRFGQYQDARVNLRMTEKLDVQLELLGHMASDDLDPLET